MKTFLALVLFSCSFVGTAPAQVIVVDTTHPTNHFIPRETLGAGVDRIAVEAIDKDLQQPTLERTQESGWQPVTYRQNTELAVEAWHWNPKGTWSDPNGKGYFVGSSTPTETIRYSYGYSLPRRGFTRNDGTDTVGFSRLTDGDLSTFWKSNPYLTQHFTGESDSLHPQWIVLDLAQMQQVDSIRIAWGEPFAKRYAVQYWTGEDPIHAPTRGVWETFLQGNMTNGKGGTETVRLTATAMPVRFLRIWMTESSNTCDSDGPGDPRNCVGYAIRELYLGTTTKGGAFHDILRHTPDQEQTTTYCSSVDPWHEESDLGSTKQAQVGFDLFFTSGVTRGLPAMIPVALLYETPENSAAEIAYLENRKYPISYVEMGEEADGQYMLPEDYAALYVQWATALHRVDPSLKLGGPSFQGVNRDIEVWPDASGRVSWLGRFVDYLKQHGRMGDLAFFSFEHYPYDPCRIPWGMLYDEPELVSHIMQVWHQDGIPADLPMFITEGNLSSGASETFQDIFAGVWLADYIGSFLNAGGNGVYFFHYLPLHMEPGCDGSPGTFGMFTINKNYEIQQRLAQFFVAQLINQEWVQPSAGEHEVYSAKGDVEDGAGHELVTAYSVRRPDGQWAVMLVNRDQEVAHKVRISFNGKDGKEENFTGPVEIATFGSEQYHWHPSQMRFEAHAEHAAERSVVAVTKGWAEPDGPIARTKEDAGRDSMYEIPAASVVVVRGSVGR
ncbi:MAG: discoidin domain-containing protein [Candidatus Sulfotelmatobacter sp.]